ncbi:MAG: phage/plasmid primase, P4 family [Verrucomicrobiota bacterium]
MKAKNYEETVNKNPVFAKYGEPFLVSDSGKVTLNERAIAVECATKNQVQYLPDTKTYERYDQDAGVWKLVHEKEVVKYLDDLLVELGKQDDQEEAVQRVGSAKLNSLCRMLQPLHINVKSEDLRGLVHVRNGVLDLKGSKSMLFKHNPKFGFKFASGVKYDPKAKCPKFIDQLLKPAIPDYDIELIQKYFGSALIGPNTSQHILIIRGRAGAGKGTLVSVMEKVLGEHYVADLRAKHLTGRFETSAFLGKRVLMGKDVPGDTLQERGARMLKSLVGGDLMQAEIKYNPTKQSIRGDYHVVLVANNNLRIALDGDEEAWGRRLIVVEYNNPKPAKIIPEFAKDLFEEEASGILNWLIDGAMEFRADLKKNHGKLSLNDEQTERINGMLHDSDSVLTFVDQRLKEVQKKDVSSDELLLGYFDLCKERKWTPVSSHLFQTRVPDLVAQKFQVCRRNDIMRDGKAVRGFKHISLN